MLPLYPYQDTGAAWLSQRRYAFLADEMGVGKTAQAVSACDRVGAKKILVLCPGKARRKWCREFDKFSWVGYPTTPIETGKDTISDNGVVVLSYDLLRNDKLRRAIYAVGPWDVVIADEAHALKGRSARRTKLCYGPKGLAERTKRFWLLSGTPAPNNAAEWWPHLRKFGIFDGDYWQFVERYCTTFEGDYGIKVTGTKDVEGVQRLLGDFMLRRKARDVLPEWPALSVVQRDLDRPKKLSDALVAHQKSQVAEFDPDNCDPDEMAELMPATLRREWGLAKVVPTIAEATEWLEARPGEKLVMFAYHPRVLDEIAEGLKAFSPVVVHGKRGGDDEVLRFEKDPKCRVFLGQILSAGTAIDLVAASTLWMVESDWVPGNNEQAIKRVQRIGQKNAVVVEFLAMPGTIDEVIQGAYQRKARDLARIYNEKSDLQKTKTPARLDFA